MGHPMSHSTHAGFRLPPLASTISGNVISTAGRGFPCRFGSPLELILPFCLAIASSATGVCHISRNFTCCISPSCAMRPVCLSKWRFIPPGSPPAIGTRRSQETPGSCAEGVRQNPDAFPAMGRTRIGCGYNFPFRIEPERGKVSEDDIESAKSEHWAVFNECEAGSYHPQDAGEFAPES